MKKKLDAGSIGESRIVLRGGRLIDPALGLDQTADVWIQKGIIESIGGQGGAGRVREFDCKGRVLVPGLIDMHVHLREPGQEEKETIETGCRAAMAGGFTAVCCMPNTKPPLDNQGQIVFVKEQAKNRLVEVHPIGAITKGLKGEELTEMGDMIGAGAVAFSDDGLPVEKAQLLRFALEYAKMFGRPIIEHCEDLSLTGAGMMHEGRESIRLGLRGIPAIGEEIVIARDLMLAEYTKGPLHIAHVSTAGGVRLIREAKKRNVSVSAETCPHYLVLTDEAVAEYNTFAKMKPPLRTEKDREALLAGLKDGTIDVIATDHAPHTEDDKDVEFDAAAFGIIGLETAVGIVLSHIVKKGILTMSQMVEKMSVNPRKILGLEPVKIEKGQRASITVLDPNLDWKVDKDSFLSKSRNTPFDGWALTGRAVGVVNQGQIYGIE